MLRCIGSEVFWNAELIRLLEFSGTLGQRITGEPFARSLERVAGWINLPIFVSIVVVFSVWIAMRVGAIAALLTAFGMLAHPSFYAGFAPNYFDHHGLLTACAFGTILGAAFMGAGWVMRDEAPNLDRRCGILPQTRRQARNGALASALCAGLGMWTSAPSVIPVIAIVGIAGAATTLWSLQTMERRTLVFDATLWRLWGRTGALISAAAYLVEYAPHTMRMRLEVNHPLYAVAWISGAELVASFGDWRANGIKPRFGRIVLAVLGLIASPVSIAIGGTRVFVLSESGLLRLHSHIAEFRRSVPRSTCWAIKRAFGSGLISPC